jgi:Restriction Enzyme Adenine Methylase Associated
MPIDGGTRNKLVAGMRLVARYKGTQHMAEVVMGEDGKIRFRLADGREFKSPSAAGSAVMSGVACNGWRFWSIESQGQAVRSESAAIGPSVATQAPVAATSTPHHQCARCGKSFVGAAQLAYHEANADRLCMPA